MYFNLQLTGTRALGVWTKVSDLGSQNSLESYFYTYHERNKECSLLLPILGYGFAQIFKKA